MYLPSWASSRAAWKIPLLQAAAPPKNPFEGLDRNDPWGLLEKANKPKDDKTPSDSTELDTPKEDNSSDYNDNSWGTEEPEESESEEAELIESGTCGKKLTWNFYSDGTLIIEGTGDMENYEEMAPWVEAGYDVKTVIIKDGVTSIGDSAFYGCKNLVSLKVPATVTSVGAFAFYECYSLTELKVSSSLTEIGAYAFGFVFDAENNTAKVLEGFELSVCEPSEALKYAKTYEVPYEVYKTADTITVDDGYTWWFWTLIAVGAVVLLAGVTVLVIIIVKKKKNANKMGVVE